MTTTETKAPPLTLRQHLQTARDLMAQVQQPAGQKADPDFEYQRGEAVRALTETIETLDLLETWEPVKGWEA